MSATIVVIYRDAGFWNQIWHVFSFALMKRQRRALVPKGFVGRISGSSQGIDHKRSNVTSIQLTRTQRTEDVRLWRLTYALEAWPRAQRPLRSGASLARSGKVSVGRGAGILPADSPGAVPPT